MMPTATGARPTAARAGVSPRAVWKNSAAASDSDRSSHRVVGIVVFDAGLERILDGLVTAAAAR